MSKHTPGPWECSNTIPDEAGSPFRQVVADLYVIAHVYVCDDEEGQANARLMAAAPELFEALKLVRMYGHDGETEDGLSVSYFVKKAIAKAEGTSDE